jgi:outer membrane protein TolC
MKYLLFLLCAITAWPAQKLTLEEAQQLALKQNRSLKLARFKVEENHAKVRGARADYYPKVLTDANYLYFNQKLGAKVNAGELGLGFLPLPLPSVPIPINLLKQNLLFGGATAVQPLTQLLKVKQGVAVAANEEEIARAQARKGEDEVAYAVEQLYYGVLISRRQKSAAELKVAAAEEQLRDAQNAVETGNALAVAAIGRRAALLEAKQSLLALENQISDYSEALGNLIGIPIRTELELVEPQRPAVTIASADDAVQRAIQESPEVREAEQLVLKARAGVKAAQTDYIPDVTLFGQYFYQTGIPTMPSNFGAAGGRMSYTVFEFGKRREQSKERRLLLEQAEENLLRVKEKIEVDARKSYRGVDRGLQMIGVAREAAELRIESERLNRDQFELGLALKSAYVESQAARAFAEADLFRAEAGWRLAYADLKRVIGAR